MNDVAIALVEHSRWKWVEGLRLVNGGGFLDLADDATAGILLGMLRDACRVYPTVAPSVDGRISVGAMGEYYLGATLGEALALALLAVWGPSRPALDLRRSWPFDGKR